MITYNHNHHSTGVQIFQNPVETGETIMRALVATLDPGEAIHIDMDGDPKLVIYGYHSGDKPGFVVRDLLKSEALESGTKIFMTEYSLKP